MANPFNQNHPKARHKNVTLNTGETIQFDSGHEFATWKILQASKAIETLNRQVKLRIKKGTYRYPEKYWRVDFAVQLRLSQTIYHIEAKSYSTAMDNSFRLTLEMLDNLNDLAVSYLLIILPNSNRSSCVTIAKRLGLQPSQVTTLSGLESRLEIGCLL